MNSFSDKTPPSFDKRTDDFAKWLRKFRLWLTITEVDKKKQGALLLLRLDDDTQDRVSELVSDEDIVKETAVETILGHLKTLYGRDESVTTFELYEEFECLKRPINMNISEYCDEFDRKLKKLEAKGTKLPAPVLVLKLLKSSNLSESEERLVRATTAEHTYDKLLKQLKKIFPFSPTGVREAVGSINDLHIKENASEVNEILYYRGKRYTLDDGSFSNEDRNVNYGQRIEKSGHYGLGVSNNTTTKKVRGTNTLDIHDNVMRCLICDSVMHLKEDCLHRFDKVYSINQEDCLEGQYQEWSSDDGIFSYEIVEVEATHTVTLEQEEYTEAELVSENQIHEDKTSEVKVHTGPLLGDNHKKKQNLKEQKDSVTMQAEDKKENQEKQIRHLKKRKNEERKLNRHIEGDRRHRKQKRSQWMRRKKKVLYKKTCLSKRTIRFLVEGEVGNVESNKRRQKRDLSSHRKESWKRSEETNRKKGKEDGRSQKKESWKRRKIKTQEKKSCRLTERGRNVEQIMTII